MNPDLIPAGIVRCDPDGCIEAANARFREWVGKDDVEGQLFSGFLGGAGKIYFETHLRPALLLKDNFEEVALQLSDGHGARRDIYLNGSVERDAKGEPFALHFACSRSEKRIEYEREIIRRRQRAEQYRALVKASPDAIVALDRDFRIIGWNKAAEMLLGYTEEEVIGRLTYPLLAADGDEAALAAMLEDLKKTPSVSIETERLHKNGDSIPVELRLAVIEGEFHEVEGYVGILRDLRAQRAAQEVIDTLHHEMVHRAKNQIAVIQAIARSTMRTTSSENFMDVFSDRLGALARNLELLSAGRMSGIGLNALIMQQLNHIGGDKSPRVTISGDDLDISMQAAEALGMAIFELSTNAVKYGALSAEARETGHLAITYGPLEDDPDTYNIRWTETGVANLTPPSHEGFGTRLTGSLLEGAVGGRRSLDYAPTGLRWELRVPRARLS